MTPYQQYHYALRIAIEVKGFSNRYDFVRTILRFGVSEVIANRAWSDAINK